MTMTILDGFGSGIMLESIDNGPNISRKLTNSIRYEIVCTYLDDIGFVFGAFC